MASSVRACPERAAPTCQRRPSPGAHCSPPPTSPAWSTAWPTSSSSGRATSRSRFAGRRPLRRSSWSASRPAASRWPAGWPPGSRPSTAHASTSAPSTSRSTATTCACAASARWAAPSCPTAASTAGWWSSSTTCSSPAAPSAPRWTRCATSAGPAAVQLAVLVDRGHRRAADPRRLRRQEHPDRAHEQVRCCWPRSTASTRSLRHRRGRATVKRHLLSAADLDRADATAVLDTAGADRPGAGRPRGEEAADAARPHRGEPVLRGLHPDPDLLRAAAKRLSADVINFSAKGSSVSKGESLKDTALTLQAMGADAVVIRHPASGAPHRLAQLGRRAACVNAGDGTHEHPTQALLDAYTIRAAARPARGRAGGHRRRRAAQPGGPLQRAAAAHPRRGGHRWSRRRRCCRSASAAGRSRSATTSTRCCRKADVVMMLRVQRERMNDSFFPSAREYSRRYGLDARRMRALPDARDRHAPRPDEPRHGDRRRGGRLGPLHDRRTGRQRRHRAHGRAVPAARR